MKASRLKQIIKEEYVNYLLEQTLLENETPDHFGGGENIDVFGYQTEHFDICKSAVMLFTKIKEKNIEGMAVEHAKKAAEHIDNVFGIEKDVVEEGSAAPEQMEEAIDNDMLFGYEIGALSMHIDDDLTRDTAFHKLHIMEIANRFQGDMSGNVNEGMLPVEKELKKMGIKYKLSGKSHKPFEKVFKPTNKNNKFYRAFDDLVDRFGLTGVVVTEAVNEMKMVNKKTGKDITSFVLKLMSGEITQKEFENLTGLKNKKPQVIRKVIDTSEAKLEKEKFTDPDDMRNESAPGYKHDCAVKVLHKEYGEGTCIPEKHTLVKEGNKHVVTHYDVKFKNGKVVEDIAIEDLKILTMKEHWHKGYKKKKKKKNESTKAYGDALKAIEREKTLKSLSKKDKETLLKLADLMKKHGMTKEGIKALKEKLVFYTDKKGRIRRFDDGR